MIQWANPAGTPRSIRARLLHPRKAAAEGPSGDNGAAAPCLELGDWLGPPLIAPEEPPSPTFFIHHSGRVYSDLDGHAILAEYGSAEVLVATDNNSTRARGNASAELRVLSVKTYAVKAKAGSRSPSRAAMRRRMHALNQPR